MQAEQDSSIRMLGYRYLANTPVTLFYRTGVLAQATAQLREAGYHVAQTNASGWLHLRGMHEDLSRLLGFPGYYGHNLDAFNDCMRDVIRREYGFPAQATGLALVFTGYDQFAGQFSRDAHILLDIIADQSRRALLHGEQVFCLLQSNDPRFELPPVGATPLLWNDAEWLNSSRGL